MLPTKHSISVQPYTHLIRRMLFIIVVSQFACTSLWFAGNAVLADIIREFHLAGNVLGHITSSIQIGFILGTLTFALFTISDRFSPSKVFVICAIAGALTNLAIFLANGLFTILLFRFLTGFCLAGIYPVGMKIASDYHNKGLGKALGYLVGALVLGTALPHLLKGVSGALPWRYVIAATSALSVLGGILVYAFVPDGPYRSRGTKPDLTAFFTIFQKPELRRAASGYFGHMWELYAFWAFIPVILTAYMAVHPKIQFSVPVVSFFIIASGALACVAGGYMSTILGSAKTAFAALLISGICCIVSPLIFKLPAAVFLAVLFIWAMAVVADSPQFSTLVAQAAQAEAKGTALTIVNSTGFFITIISIQLINFLSQIIPPEYLFICLAIGPLYGLIAMQKLVFVRKIPQARTQV